MDISENIIYHYPPELLNLLIETIPLLCRSKKDVIVFFRGAGVPRQILDPLAEQLSKDPKSLNKYEISRTALSAVNEHGDAGLRERREILKRITEFEDFSTCWPDDQLKAKGLVAEIRRVVHVKDSFTRIEKEREDERRQRQVEQIKKLEAVEQRRAKLSMIHKSLLALFAETNAQKRGKQLESVLNNLFRVNDVLISEAFELAGINSEGVVEQIDGVIELDGAVYLVEMKWWNKPLGLGEVSTHLVRVFSRGGVRGLLISASGYTEPAITTVRDALRQTVVVLCSLEEIIKLLENQNDFREFLREKIQAAQVHKNPYFDPQ